jgi:hypothetical protein
MNIWAETAAGNAKTSRDKSANAIAGRPRRPDPSMPLRLGVMGACFSLKTRQIQACRAGRIAETRRLNRAIRLWSKGARWVAVQSQSLRSPTEIAA